MTDSSFWEDLAVKFRELPRKFGALVGDRGIVIGDSPIGNWRLRGSTTSGKVEFEALARRGALHLPNPVCSDLLIAWLEALAQYDDGEHVAEMHGAYIAGEVRHETRTTSYDLAERSANYCKVLESEALESEAERERNNNPKNWHPLRAEYEVFKRLRDLTSGQHEEIPEAFVRQSISRRLGIQSDEVTLGQIRHEVSALLPSYPAIRLVPSVLEPKSELDNYPLPASIKTRSATISETLAEQIRRLRDECRWTNEELAEVAKLSTRQVSRHVSRGAIPYKRNIATYERVFSKVLKRNIVIREKS